MQETLDLKGRRPWSLGGVSTAAEEDALPSWSRKSLEVTVGIPELPAEPEATAAGRGRAGAGGAARLPGKTCGCSRLSWCR